MWGLTELILSVLFKRIRKLCNSKVLASCWLIVHLHRTDSDAALKRKIYVLTQSVSVFLIRH